MTHADSYISMNRQRKSQARPNTKPRKRSNSGNDQTQRDCIVTATIEAAEDLKRKLANRIGAEATTRVRTMASILVNGFKEHTHNRLLIDEAMMNHFGAIITAALLAKARNCCLSAT
ncbi:hypothetical protein EVAR_90448_1 [Eumeta japonica]|uniref:Uncharacterized protein n=1 Tax=Eumeta variegata TaxID=151549 RepID=A0A4C1SKB5_EUMVA|nr:hypothetical protein EVAR_90448_1 [Eumeta japonica]